MATELAQAYVQIIPSAKGIKGSISSALSGEAASSGSSAGQSFGSSMVSKLKTVIAAAGIGKMVGSILNEGAQLEQSIGGIETLFGAGGQSIEEYAKSVGKAVSEIEGEYNKLMQSQTTVLENADKAYMTAGLSANDYMQQVTSFSASLLQSLDGDTNAAAAAADQAIIDMSDNVNKMGTSMEMIQNAYRGFARQNYTMLDNLALGYSGTKSEMERLLADAQEISGIEYDINNLADVYSAIHVIQTELGITGTTAKEAEGTFSGSFASMQASAQNLMANMALGKDLGPSIQALVKTASTFFFNNFLPMIGNIASAIPGTIGTLITTAAPILIEQLSTLITSIGEFITGGGLMQLLTSLQTALTGILTNIQENGPAIMQQGYEFISNFIMGIVEQLPSVITTIGDMINQILSFFMSNLPQFLQTGTEMVISLIQGIISNLPEIVASVMEVIRNFVGTIMDNLPEILQAGIEMIFSLIGGLLECVPDLLASAGEIIGQLIDAFLNTDWLQLGLDIIGGIGQGIIDGVSGLLDSAINAASSLVDGILGFFGIGSPSKLMAKEVGRWIPAGIGVGITDNADTAINAMDYVGQGITTSVRGMDLSSTNPTTINLDAIAEAVRIGAERANLSVYFDTRAVADTVTPRIDRNLNVSAMNKMRYSQ